MKKLIEKMKSKEKFKPNQDKVREKSKSKSKSKKAIGMWCVEWNGMLCVNKSLKTKESKKCLIIEW